MPKTIYHHETYNKYLLSLIFIIPIYHIFLQEEHESMMY